MGDMSINEHPHLKASLRHSRSHQNVGQLKQQLNSNQKYKLDFKEKHKLNFTKNSINAGGSGSAVTDQNNAYSSKHQILNTHDNYEM